MPVCYDGEIDHTGLKDDTNNQISVKSGKFRIPHRSAAILVKTK